MQVSVLMPIHGQPPYLEDAVASVINQELQSWELILVLDRPTPNLHATVDKLIDRDSRIRKIESSGSGIVDALNIGLQSANSELIARIDSDDLMEPNRLSLQRDFLLKSPKVACVGSQMIFINSEEEILGISNYPLSFSKIQSHLLYQNCMGHPAVMLRKKEVLDAGGYRKFLTGVEDYDLWLRLSKAFQLSNIDLPLTRYRISPNQYSKSFGEDYTILEEAARIDFFFGLINEQPTETVNPKVLKQQIFSARRRAIGKNPLVVLISYQGYFVSRIIRVIGSDKQKTRKFLFSLPFALGLIFIAPNSIMNLLRQKFRKHPK